MKLLLFALIFIALLIFYYFTQKSKIRKEDRREKLKEKHQRYLESLLQHSKDKRD